jgi:hypothetical protein
MNKLDMQHGYENAAWTWTYSMDWNHGHVESLQSHMILTMSHWSSGLTCLLPATRVTGSNPLGGLM